MSITSTRQVFSSFYFTFHHFSVTQFEPREDSESSNALKLYRLLIKMAQIVHIDRVCSHGDGDYDLPPLRVLSLALLERKCVSKRLENVSL